MTAETKALKDLPGFERNLDVAMLAKEGRLGYAFDIVGEFTVPGLKRVDSSFFLTQLALIVGIELDDQRLKDRRRLRLVQASSAVTRYREKQAARRRTRDELAARRRGCLMSLCAYKPLGASEPANETEVATNGC